MSAAVVGTLRTGVAADAGYVAIGIVDDDGGPVNQRGRVVRIVRNRRDRGRYVGVGESPAHARPVSVGVVAVGQRAKPPLLDLEFDAGADGMADYVRTR
jgi:hypothetical protein